MGQASLFRRPQRPSRPRRPTGAAPSATSSAETGASAADTVGAGVGDVGVGDTGPGDPGVGDGGAGDGRAGDAGVFASPVGRCRSTAATSSGASGSVSGRNRATTEPDGSTRNFSKFHRTSPAFPSGSGASMSRPKSSCRSGPLTSTFSVIGKVTPKLISQKSAICRDVPGS